MAFKRIQEYIGTEDATAGTLLIPKLIMPTLIEEVDKTLLPRELAQTVWTPNQIQGSSFTVNLVTPNTMDVRIVGEGAEIPMDALDYSTVTFTPKKYGVAVRITREMIEDAQFDVLQGNLRAAGRRFAEKETELILSKLYSGAGNTIGGGAAITIANITTAIQYLNDADYTPTDIILGNEVLQDLQNIDTFVEANKVGNTDMLQRGFLGVIYGLRVARFSTNAAPSTAYSKYAFVIDRSQAYAIAIKRDITVENFDLPSLDMQGAAITMRIDVQLLRSSAVALITTS
jgi:HK97 family phage major capsid protein